ncbi:hypothetical protein CR64_18205 [Pseudomonas aeruginosa]|nr:hypothetical protein CR64_18205 [Pseudomonas aeruginosa]
METGEGLCQGRRRHHEAVDVTQPATQRAQDVLRQVLAMGALEGHVGQIVVQLVDLEGPRERLHPPHGLETLLADLALQHQYVRVVALQIGHVHQADRQRAIDGCRLAQRAERLDHPVMAAAEQVGGVRQDSGQGPPPLQRAPGQLRVGQLETAFGLQRKARVIGGIARQQW